MSNSFATPWIVALQVPRVYGIFQARIQEWVITSYTRGSSWSRDWTSVSRTPDIVGRFFISEPLGKPYSLVLMTLFLEFAYPTTIIYNEHYIYKYVNQKFEHQQPREFQLKYCLCWRLLNLCCYPRHISYEPFSLNISASYGYEGYPYDCWRMTLPPVVISISEMTGPSIQVPNLSSGLLL